MQRKTRNNAEIAGGCAHKECEKKKLCQKRYTQCVLFELASKQHIKYNHNNYLKRDNSNLREMLFRRKIEK